MVQMLMRPTIPEISCCYCLRAIEEGPASVCSGIRTLHGGVAGQTGSDDLCVDQGWNTQGNGRRGSPIRPCCECEGSNLEAKTLSIAQKSDCPIVGVVEHRLDDDLSDRFCCHPALRALVSPEKSISSFNQDFLLK